ncbi:MAG: type II toxin-antitoxin system RelE/ParE family toxin [Elainellaceae cyanobacterium]
MPTEPYSVQIQLTPRFQKDLRALAKRYRHIRSDLKSLVAQLEAGELPGDLVQGLSLTVYKVRVRNSDIRKGKSAGYRVIYYLKADEQIILVTIYSKSDQSDVDAQTIRDAIARLNL